MNKTREIVPIRYCLDSSFDLVEQLMETVKDWEIDFRQMTTANSPFRLQQLLTPRMLYTQGSLDSHFCQQGGPTAGLRTFALHTYDGSDYQWCGERVDPHSLVVMPEDGQFESVSRPGFSVFTVSLSHALLERTAELQFQRPLAELLGPGGKVHYRAGEPLRRLRAVLHSLSQHIAAGREQVVNHYSGGGISRLEHTVAHLLLSCLIRGDEQIPRDPRGKRMLALKRAMEIIEHTPGSTLEISTLVEQTGVSRRTLEYAFQDGVGVSPTTFLKSAQLRALHKELLTVDLQNYSVADVSARHGFTHAGQLAADYRKLFGELPSATLRRAS